MAERASGLILRLCDKYSRLGALTDDAPAGAGMAEAGAHVYGFRELEDLDPRRSSFVENDDTGLPASALPVAPSFPRPRRAMWIHIDPPQRLPLM